MFGLLTLSAVYVMEKHQEQENDISLTDNLFTMSVPDPVNFGVYNGVGINYGHVRAMSPDEQVRALKSRLDYWFFGQVPDNIGAFPLSIMCCVGIETLGQIAFSSKESGEGFKEVLSKIHVLFSRQITKRALQDLQKLLPRKELKNVKYYGDLFYTYFRNSMFHGYRASAVFLTQDKDLDLVAEQDGALFLDPFMLWENFKLLYNNTFDKILNNPQSRQGKQCTKYLEDLLKKPI